MAAQGVVSAPFPLLGNSSHLAIVTNSITLVAGEKFLSLQGLHGSHGNSSDHPATPGGCATIDERAVVNRGMPGRKE